MEWQSVLLVGCLSVCLAGPVAAQKSREVSPGNEKGRAELGLAMTLLDEEKLDEAMPHFRLVVKDGGNVDGVARLIFRDASVKGIRLENWPYALRGIVAAESFDLSPALRTEVDFWHGWTLYQNAAQLEVAQTVESATLTKPMFEEAKALLEAGQAFAEGAHFSMSGIMVRVDGYIEMESKILTP